MLKLLELVIPSNHADAAAGGAGLLTGWSLAIAGMTGQVPDGVPTWLWLVLSAASTVLTPLIYSEIRVRRAARAAKKRAEAEARKQAAADLEEQAARELADERADNDEHARKLKRDAAAARADAAGLEGEAEALEREANKERT